MQVQKVSGIYADRVFLCFPICIFSLTDGAIATEDMITSKKSREKHSIHVLKVLTSKQKFQLDTFTFLNYPIFYKELD